MIPPPQTDPANNADQYCSVGWTTGDPGDTLIGGSGNNAIFGGGGPNKLIGGQGANFIEDGPSNDTITGGPSLDVIDATNGPSTVNPGKTALIDTVGPGLSIVNCPKGNSDYVTANRSDQIKGCAHVYYQSNTTRRARHRTVTRKSRKVIPVGLPRPGPGRLR